MTRNETIRALQEEYARLRAQNERAHEQRLSEAADRNPEIGQVVADAQSLFMAQARALLAHPADAAQLARRTREQAAALRARQEALLQAAGFPGDYLDPIYRCQDCRDTGYVSRDGIRSMCACMERRLIERLYESARERGIAEQRFETFQDEFLPDNEPVDGVHTQRTIAQAARNLCKAYACAYPDTEKLGVLLTGETGLGKTFLLHCIENKLLDRGFAPISVTAYRLFETMRGCHFSDADKRQEFDQLMKCDILLIDDLGTEPIMQNITREYLFTLLNERLTQRRHTVIATNLGVSQLMNLYGERVFSRLFDMMNVSVAQLKGRDLRMLAGRKK